MAMGTSAGPMPNWSTASFGAPADTSPMELSALGSHLSVCRPLGARLCALRCGAEAMHGFVASRFVTTLLLTALAIGLVWLMV
jgi:hypothetical protein